MGPGAKLATFSTRHPWLVTLAMVQVSVILVALAVLPSVWPKRFSSLHPLQIDTDPENMLPHSEPVRVFHDKMKKEMGLWDMVVVGVVNEHNPNGVFNPDTLKRVYELTEYAKTLQWPDPDHPGQQMGVISVDMIAPSTVDNISQGDQPGTINFSWLLGKPPYTEEQALAVRDQARRIPFLDGTLVSEDGKALCIYVPLSRKDLSNEVYVALNKKIATLGGDDDWHITGLPVAEDVFGVEMFKQMAISAPVAMLVIFLLMLLFFRRLSLILSPMILAMMCVMQTMGLLVATGNTVHIMSSMIPIFIMPIAVLDAVHILSDFFDRYQATRDRQKTIIHVMDTLFWPLLYTSLTTVVGFSSLALVTIPPVQVFGTFIAFGVAMAWIWTVTFIPAFVMFIPARWLENFGTMHDHDENLEATGMAKLLNRIGVLTTTHAKGIVAVAVIVSAVAVYGIFHIRINDNPIKWFENKHPIRIADKVLNQHFGGTYMGYLTIEAPTDTMTVEDYATHMQRRFESAFGEEAGMSVVRPLFTAELGRLGKVAENRAALLDQLESYADKQMWNDEAQYDNWDKVMSFLAKERGRADVFKQPEVLAFLDKVQTELKAAKLSDGSKSVVGKSNSLSDIVKTVYRELQSGTEEDFRLPATSAGVAQTLLQYQNSHRPQDLWHLVTPDYRTSVIWVQLTSGDNREMERVVEHMDKFFATTPMPMGIEFKHEWFGQTYINVIWQNRMVAGMLSAFLGSFLVVFLMMTLLYRSALWGLLSMIPLTVTIGVIYGLIGLIGKDYDMPVAVLSSLSLGLAIDYAIHFLSRSRQLYLVHGSWSAAAGPVFGEPARAIARNAIVIGVGFLPLLLAPLVPYKTVGFFIAGILSLAGLSTLLLLPALMALFEKQLFPRTKKCCLMCNCVTCMVSAVVAVIAVVMNIHRFLAVGWTHITWASLVAVIILLQICYWMGKSKRCQMPLEDSPESKS